MGVANATATAEPTTHGLCLPATPRSVAGVRTVYEPQQQRQQRQQQLYGGDGSLRSSSLGGSHTTASAAAAHNAAFAETTMTTSSSSSSHGCSGAVGGGSSSDVLAQQLRQLDIHWPFFDAHFDRIAYHFIARLLAAPATLPLSSSSSLSSSSVAADNNNNNDNNDDSDAEGGGHGMLACTAALRVAVLGLEATGLRRVMDVLAYLAAGCESRHARLAQRRRLRDEQRLSDDGRSGGSVAGALAAAACAAAAAASSSTMWRQGVLCGGGATAAHVQATAKDDDEYEHDDDAAVRGGGGRVSRSRRRGRRTQVTAATAATTTTTTRLALELDGYNAELLSALHASSVRGSHTTDGDNDNDAALPRRARQQQAPRRGSGVTTTTASTTCNNSRRSSCSSSTLHDMTREQPPHLLPHLTSSNNDNNTAAAAATTTLRAPRPRSRRRVHFRDASDDRGAALCGLHATAALELLCVALAHWQLAEADVLALCVHFVAAVHDVHDACTPHRHDHRHGCSAASSHARMRQDSNVDVATRATTAAAAAQQQLPYASTARVSRAMAARAHALGWANNNNNNNNNSNSNNSSDSMHDVVTAAAAATTRTKATTTTTTTTTTSGRGRVGSSATLAATAPAMVTAGLVTTASSRTARAQAAMYGVVCRHVLPYYRHACSVLALVAGSSNGGDDEDVDDDDGAGSQCNDHMGSSVIATAAAASAAVAPLRSASSSSSALPVLTPQQQQQLALYHRCGSSTHSSNYSLRHLSYSKDDVATTTAAVATTRTTTATTTPGNTTAATTTKTSMTSFVTAGGLAMSVGDDGDVFVCGTRPALPPTASDDAHAQTTTTTTAAAAALALRVRRAAVQSLFRERCPLLPTSVTLGTADGSNDSDTTTNTNTNTNNNNNNNNSSSRGASGVAARCWTDMVGWRSDCCLHYAEVVHDTSTSTGCSSNNNNNNNSSSSSHHGSSRSHVAEATDSDAAERRSSGGGGHGGARATWQQQQRPLPSVYGDALACVGGAATCALATRLLQLRGHYLYVYDAVASTYTILGGDMRRSAALHDDGHTPMTLIDVSAAAGSDAVLVGAADDTEVMHVGPSRSMRLPRMRQHNHSSSSDSSSRHRRSRRGDKNDDDDDDNDGDDDDDDDEVHVHRVQDKLHELFLFTLPANTATAAPANDDDDRGRSDRVARGADDNATGLRASGAAGFTSSYSGGMTTTTTTTASSPTRAGGGGNAHADDTSDKKTTRVRGVRTPPPAPLDLSCCTRLNEYAPTASGDVLALTVYPLRVRCRGVLHHFLFQNAATRASWRQTLEVRMTCTRSRQQLQRIAAATHDVGAFVRRRLSFPVVPAAFEYLSVLGAGTFGRVLLARHRLTGRSFALKVIRKTGFHGLRNVVEARRERKILDAVDCPYIMRLHTAFQTDSRVYLLLDYLPGGELLMHTQRAPHHRFDEASARFFIAELAVAVHALQQHGMVHRDVKGDNLVLDAGGHVVLTDFGFAKKITLDEDKHDDDNDDSGDDCSCGCCGSSSSDDDDESSSDSGSSDDDAAARTRCCRHHRCHGASSSSVTTPRATRNDTRHATATATATTNTTTTMTVVAQRTSCGTLAYMAPEILHSSRKVRGYGFEVDWWSLGVVLFTILTGYFPFLRAEQSETSNAIVHSPLQFPQRVSLSSAAQDLLLRLVEKNPAQRIATLAQLKQHAFFDGFDWVACEHGTLRPPLLLHKDMYKKVTSLASAMSRLRACVQALDAGKAGSTTAAADASPSSTTTTAANDASVNNTTRAAAAAAAAGSGNNYAREFTEEVKELRLVEAAYGRDVTPTPSHAVHDVFGPLYDRQEECGSDRGDNDDAVVVAADDASYIPHLSMTRLRQTRRAHYTVITTASNGGNKQSQHRGVTPHATTTLPSPSTSMRSTSAACFATSGVVDSSAGVAAPPPLHVYNNNNNNNNSRFMTLHTTHEQEVNGSSATSRYSPSPSCARASIGGNDTAASRATCLPHQHNNNNHNNNTAMTPRDGNEGGRVIDFADQHDNDNDNDNDSSDSMGVVADDYDEDAYASDGEVRHVCAVEASFADTTLFYRPAYE